MELVEIAQQLNISLHESEITLEELRRVIEYNRTKLAKAFDEVPEDLVGSMKSVVLRAYRARKKQEPSLTFEAYLSEFLEVRDTLENEWGITVFDEPVERDIDPRSLSE